MESDREPPHDDVYELDRVAWNLPSAARDEPAPFTERSTTEAPDERQPQRSRGRESRGTDADRLRVVTR